MTVSMSASRNQPLLPNVGVLVLVAHPWDVAWMAPHHVLARLGRYFHVVWMNPAHGWRDILTRRKRASVQEGARSPSPGLVIHDAEAWLPKLHRPAWLRRLTFAQRLERARRVLTDRGCQKIVLYLWRPEFEEALRTVPFDLSCYHIDDEFSFSPVEVPISEAEGRVIAAVDQVFIISPALLEKKGTLNPHTAFAPMGVDYHAYANAVAEPRDLTRIPHPRVGYTGLIKKQLDWSLLRHLTAHHPEWSFVFVGPLSPHPEIHGAIQELSSRRNVHFLGGKSVQELAAYPQHFDVCIMPYQADDYTKYIYPLKLHEYLASGRPTVGTPIRSLEDFADVVSLAATPEDWSAAIAMALRPEANSVERGAARRAVAQQHDWPLLVRRIAETIACRVGCEFVEPVDPAGTDEGDGWRPPQGAPAAGRVA